MNKKKLISGVVLAAGMLFSGSTISHNAEAASNVVMWGNMQLVKGQIGEVTILQNTSLYKLGANKQMTFARTLKKGSSYRVYSESTFAGVTYYGVGAGYYVKASSQVKYQTPPKALLAEVNGTTQQSASSSPTVSNMQLVKGQTGEVTILQNTSLYKLGANKQMTFARTLKKGSSYHVYSESTFGGVTYYGVGAGYYVKASSQVKYQTPATGSSTPSGSTTQQEEHSVTALQQKLCDLGYLPLTDTFQWKYTNIPASLKSLWQPGVDNVMTQGAIMEFQADNGLSTDGIAGPLTWAAIDNAIANNKQNPHGYSFVSVSGTSPFTLYLWNNGQYVLKSLANLGIPKSQTVTGTYPVYLQYQSQEMKGTNPDGTTYDDPGVPYVSYFYKGEAIHGFPRASYGSQQSLGCVELPYAAAQTAWQYIHIGTLVTID